MTEKWFVLEKEYWEKIDRIIIFGYGRQGKKALETLRGDFYVERIIENNPNTYGMNEDETVICGPDYLINNRNTKIVVTVIERYYNDISCQLQQLGYKENIDYVSYQIFITEWYYRFKNKLYIPKTDLPITSFCSLNCEKCHIYIPYWKKREHYEWEKIKSTLDLFFENVDYVFDMDVLGGEPFLHPNIDQIILYIGEHYRNKVGYFGLITNGTIIPNDNTIKLLANNNVCVSISDYELSREYTQKVDTLCEVLARNGIRFFRNSSIKWFDFGHPCDEPRFEGNKAAQHMKLCNSIYHVINDEKYYACGTAWAAQRSGLFPESDYGYVDLRKDDRENIRKSILACTMLKVKNDYLEFCQICGGFGVDNKSCVPTAKQL